MEEKKWLICLHVGNSFELEKTVCSHGLFMMAPNLWIPSSKTLQRSLRLADSTTTATVRISQDPLISSSLLICVFGPNSFSLQDEHAIKAQVARMLRISEDNDQKISAFHKIHDVAKKRGFGRIFRSPTLFEDMVKCILLCNCQWSRTLSMVRALCELQLELKGDPLGCSAVEAAYPNEMRIKAEDFLPTTPIQKETKRKRGKNKKAVINLESKFLKNDHSAIGMTSRRNCHELSGHSRERELSPSVMSVEDSYDKWDSSHLSTEIIRDVCLTNGPNLHEERTCGPCGSFCRIGDFPTPEELAIIDEGYLTKRCNLGYRGIRILRLAQSIVENRLRLTELEIICDGASLSNYDELTQKLLSVDGIGPYTCANVLMCMGFYQKIPADSETVRHLKQFHARSKCTIRTVQEDAKEIYENYAPFQFLAYWMELWDCYEKRFGKLNEMPYSQYKLITASNMKNCIP